MWLDFMGLNQDKEHQHILGEAKIGIWRWFNQGVVGFHRSGLVGADGSWEVYSFSVFFWAVALEQQTKELTHNNLGTSATLGLKSIFVHFQVCIEQIWPPTFIGITFPTRLFLTWQLKNGVSQSGLHKDAHLSTAFASYHPPTSTPQTMFCPLHIPSCKVLKHQARFIHPQLTLAPW